MIVKLLTEHHLEFLGVKKAAEARWSLHMSKCHIVGNLIYWLILSVNITDDYWLGKSKVHRCE